MVSKKESLMKGTGMNFVFIFFVLWVVNVFAIRLANYFFPDFLELGTASISFYAAAWMSMGVLALVDTLAFPFVRVYEKYKGKTFTDFQWIALYFVINAVFVWIIARLAVLFGLGIASWKVAVVLGLSLDIVQGVALMAQKKYTKKYFN